MVPCSDHGLRSILCLSNPLFRLVQTVADSPAIIETMLRSGRPPRLDRSVVPGTGIVCNRPCEHVGVGSLASGDLSLVVPTLLDLQSPKVKSVTFLLNDVNPVTVARNIVILQVRRVGIVCCPRHGCGVEREGGQRFRSRVCA